MRVSASTARGARPDSASITPSPSGPLAWGSCIVSPVRRVLVRREVPRAGASMPGSRCARGSAVGLVLLRPHLLETRRCPLGPSLDRLCEALALGAQEIDRGDRGD